MIENKINIDDSLLDCIDKITVYPNQIGLDSYKDINLLCLYTVRNKEVMIKAFCNHEDPLWFRSFSPKHVNRLYEHTKEVLTHKQDKTLIINNN